MLSTNDSGAISASMGVKGTTRMMSTPDSLMQASLSASVSSCGAAVFGDTTWSGSRSKVTATARMPRAPGIRYRVSQQYLVTAMDAIEYTDGHRGGAEVRHVLRPRDSKMAGN